MHHRERRELYEPLHEASFLLFLRAWVEFAVTCVHRALRGDFRSGKIVFFFFFLFFFKHANFDDLHVDRETEDLEYPRLMSEGTISMPVSRWMNVAMDP